MESSITEKNMAERLLTQNNLAGTPEEITVTQMIKKTGTSTYVIEASPNLHLQLTVLQRVLLGVARMSDPRESFPSEMHKMCFHWSH